MRQIANITELKSLIGQEVAASDWVCVTQERINTFADATDDHQWIHVDVERAKRESPYGSTIAHGFLTLSLIPGMIQNALKMSDVKLQINYGLNKLRFPAPVPVDSKLRAHLHLLEVKDIPNGAEVHWDIVVEREGFEKPVCVTEAILLRF